MDQPVVLCSDARMSAVDPVPSARPAPSPAEWSPAPAAERAVLRPGLRVLRRERDMLQIGLDPARAVRLPATTAVCRTLEVIAEGGRLDDCDPEVVAGLARMGVLREGAAWHDAHVGAPTVRSFGQPLPGPLRAALERTGLAPTAGEAAPRSTTRRPEQPVLLVGVGEPHRELLDDLVADGVAHLLVRFSEGDAVLGPYVVPGASACLRCVDAHHTDRDPRWPLLVEQQAAQTARPRRDGVPDPVDPLLAQLAVAWAARDLLAGTAGAAAPSTFSTTIRLPPDLADFEAISWLRHPGCGCGLSAPPLR